MAQHYSNPKRADDSHALPDVEVFYVDENDIEICAMCNKQESGAGHHEHVGWYWQACFPGCLPDSDPMGPFDTEAKALADAQGHECREMFQ